MKIKLFKIFVNSFNVESDDYMQKVNNWLENEKPAIYDIKQSLNSNDNYIIITVWYKTNQEPGFYFNFK
jgi:predicted DNA-binding ArsR family transcriptional regulator